MSLRASIVVAAYNMPRELPRTIRSLSPVMQKNVRSDDYEIIVVDNGSTEPFDEAECRRWCPELTILRSDGYSPSPAAAVNRGIAAARSDLIGVFIDGARLATPGIVNLAIMAAAVHSRPIIVTLGFHLGHRPQFVSIPLGYDSAEEDSLLEASGWVEDGYRLFGISVFAGSSQRGWFGPIAESNGIFMPRALWSELAGYDEQFETPGGGLVNLDLFRRAVELRDIRVITLLGEGTFHQVHGGTSTNTPGGRFKELQVEYRSIRGRDFEVPAYETLYMGFLHPSAYRSIARSAQTAIRQGNSST